jgi:uncharacterized membrane protein YkvA (DUF1232 family)
VLKPGKVIPDARCAMPPLKLMTGLSVFLVIPMKSSFRLSALSVQHVVLFSLVKIKIVCTVEQVLTQPCNSQMSKNNIFRLGFLIRLFQDLKLLLPLIADYWKGKYRNISAKSIIIFLIALVYIISPIDLIPDYIIGLGQIDDAVILGLALYFLEKDLRKYKEWKDRN